MNRRQFLTASIFTSVAALFFSRRDTAAEYAPKTPPPQVDGWCLEYHSPDPSDQSERATVFIPIYTNDD